MLMGRKRIRAARVPSHLRFDGALRRKKRRSDIAGVIYERAIWQYQASLSRFPSGFTAGLFSPFLNLLLAFLGQLPVACHFADNLFGFSGHLIFELSHQADCVGVDN
jgi:hypothetical protein